MSCTRRSKQGRDQIDTLAQAAWVNKNVDQWQLRVSFCWGVFSTTLLSIIVWHETWNQQAVAAGVCNSIFLIGGLWLRACLWSESLTQVPGSCDFGNTPLFHTPHLRDGGHRRSEPSLHRSRTGLSSCSPRLRSACSSRPPFLQQKPNMIVIVWVDSSCILVNYITTAKLFFAIWRSTRSKNILCWFNCCTTEKLFFLRRNQHKRFFPSAFSSRVVFSSHSCLYVFTLGHIYTCLHTTHS